MLKNEKCTTLKEVCDIFDLTNMVVELTCFTKDALPSLNDIILTNKPNYCMNTNNYNCGISYVHNIISIQIKGNMPSNKKELICFRSFKNFDDEKFTEDLNQIDFDKLTDQDDVNTIYSDFEEAFIQTVDKHAPVKKRKSCQNPAPFIDKELRKTVYKKRQLYNKYNKFKTKSNWENYRQQRNIVTKIKKKYIKTYFFERCIGGPKSKDF